MKIILSIVLFFIPSLAAYAQQQYPPIGIINFYGLRKVSEQQARAALQIKAGDDVSDAVKEAAQKRLEALPNVEQAQVSRLCCAEGSTILYVGIREIGAPVLRFRPAPHGAIRLPDAIVKAGEDFSAAHDAAVLANDAGEDTSAGHSLMRNPQARAAQEKFIPLARQNLKLLRRVLRESSDAGHRALAAEIIAYAADKRSVVADLIYCISDTDGTVRNNSIRALGLIAELAQNQPEKKITVPSAPFIAMLNSIEWSDRNKSSLVLLRLTEKRDKKLLAELRSRALPSLVEMARWTYSGHAFAPFIILARVGNISDTEIQKAIELDRRETVIETILKTTD